MYKQVKTRICTGTVRVISAKDGAGFFSRNALGSDVAGEEVLEAYQVGEGRPSLVPDS